jgi:hypothetical protein
MSFLVFFVALNNNFWDQDRHRGSEHVLKKIFCHICEQNGKQNGRALHINSVCGLWEAMLLVSQRDMGLSTFEAQPMRNQYTLEAVCIRVKLNKV